MKRDEFVLTSTEEAFALAERGREVRLDMVTDAHIRVLRKMAELVKRSRSVSWNTFNDENSGAQVDVLSHEAFVSFMHLCGEQEWERQTVLFSLSQAVSGQAFGRVYFRADASDRPGLTREFIEFYKRMRDGELARTISSMYQATDPTLPPEYAAALMPESRGLTPVSKYR